MGEGAREERVKDYDGLVKVPNKNAVDVVLGVWALATPALAAAAARGRFAAAAAVAARAADAAAASSR